jgi:hypothetical protein
MEANKVLESQKKDREAKERQDEVNQDRQELEVARQTRKEYVAASDMLKY